MVDRMGSIEAIIWRLGGDSTLRMTVGNLMLLDGVPPVEALAKRLAAAAEKAPRLRQRPDDVARARTRLAWVDVDGFDAAAHVRTLAVPPPGSRRQVLDLVALLEPLPFGPDRSPWDVTVIEGVEGGKGAVYLRAHHVLTDGLGGISLLGLLLDETAPADRPPRARAAARRVAAPVEEAADPNGDVDEDGDRDGHGVWRARRRRPGTVTVTIDLTKAAHPVAEGVAAALRLDPVDTVVRGLQRGLDLANSVSRQVVVTGGPLSPLPTTRSVQTRFETVSVPDARRTALALGGSRNDLLVAATAAGFGRYHERLGLACPELRLATPARRHRDTAVGGNWFAPTRLEVPTDQSHPGPYFGVVAERLARARHEPAVRVTPAIAGAIARVPTRLLVPAVHAETSSVDFFVTALPGPRGARRLCGAAVEESYPFGPRLGTLMNVTAFGNGDRLDVGIGVDPAAVAEPEVLVECVVSAFAELAPTAGSGAGR